MNTSTTKGMTNREYVTQELEKRRQQWKRPQVMENGRARKANPQDEQYFTWFSRNGESVEVLKNGHIMYSASGREDDADSISKEEFTNNVLG